MNTHIRDLVKNRPTLTYFILAFTLTWVGSLVYYFTLPKNGQVLHAS